MAAAAHRPPLPAGPWLVVGLARSGQAAARLLAGRGERVLACDAAHPDGAERLEALGVEVHLDGPGTDLLDDVRAVVKSPGVPREAPVVAAAHAAGLPVIGELELAWRLLPNRFIGVTGTNGKTTTTELLGHLYRTAGEPVVTAGNVGTPLASLPGTLTDDTTVVCECSSFQLEDAEAFAPDCAVFLNLTPDHLDRHGSMDDYRDAKLRIFAHQGSEAIAVVDDAERVLRDQPPAGGARRLCFDDAAGSECATTVRDGVIHWQGEALIDADRLALPGPHNRRNAMAAATAALAMGLPADAVAAGLGDFPGVAHRLEFVGERGGVRYVNDSKATNVASAAVGVRSFERGVHLICGGSLKGGSFSGLARPVAERCDAVHAIGEAAAQIAADLEPELRAGPPLTRHADLPAALRSAHAEAVPGDVVLLSPACASFDAYTSYEHRGDHFRRLVAELP